MIKASARILFGVASVAAGCTITALAGSTPLTINEGFEQIDVPNGGIYANGWLRQDNSDAPLRAGPFGHGWHRAISNPAYDAPAKSMVVPLSPAEVPASGTVSVWLLSPPIAFGPSFSLSFQARSFFDPDLGPGVDRLQVRLCAGEDCSEVGSAAEDVGDFGALLLDINAGELDDGFPMEWTRYSVEANPAIPASGTGRIAFRYYVHQDADSHAAGGLGVDRVVVASDPDVGAGLALKLTAAAYDPAAPDACGAATQLDVTAGDTLNLCYEVTNTSAQPLLYHWLRDASAGVLLSEDERQLEPGASYRYNRQMIVGPSVNVAATATSQAEPPDYQIDDMPTADYIDARDGEVVEPGAIATLPIEFDMYGKKVGDYCVLRDGVFTVAANPSCPETTLGAIPTGDSSYISGSPFAAVYAERFWPNYGQIFRKVVGAAPNRKFVIQWYQHVPITIPPALIDPSRGLDAELILHEGSNAIEFQYRNTHFGAVPDDDDGGAASIGLQKDLQGLSYSYQTQSLVDVRRIVWTPTTPAAQVDTRALAINALVPQLQGSPSSISVSAPSHGSTQSSFRIGNGGAGRLDWTAATAALLKSEGATTGVHGEVERAFYTFDLYNAFAGYGYGQLIHFNPERTDYRPPDAADGLANIDGRIILAAAFAGDDFSTLYAIDEDSRELMRWHFADQPFPPQPYDIVGVVPILLDTVNITGMREDPTSGTMYLSTSDGTSSTLWTLDLATAAVKPVGVIGGAVAVDDITFDKQGKLYAMDSTLDALLTIDTRTAESTTIGPLGIDAIGRVSALDFDAATGALYLIALIPFGEFDTSEIFYSVDLTTGHAQALSQIFGVDDDPHPLWGTLAIAHRTSSCSDPAAVPWLSVSPAGGVIEAGTPAQDLIVSFDGAELADGDYEANLCVYSNDPSRRRWSIPVRFQLGAEQIFTDGFETAP